MRPGGSSTHLTRQPYPAADSIDIGGWHLTDNRNDLGKWEFPSTVIDPNGYLIVFASDRNEAISGQQLHTNFELDATGEYLALVHPDGITIASEYDAGPQFADVSYGHQMEQVGSELLGADSGVAAHIPSDDSLGTSWQEVAFVADSTWITESAPGVPTTGPAGFD